MESPIFSASNHHAAAPSGSEPPVIDGDEANTYHGYFENVHGEQSLFVCRRDTGEALLYSGDADWAAFPVVDGKVKGLVLSPDEQHWLQACLLGAGLVR